MNILYCGDSNIVDGLIISILSLIKHESSELYIYVFSMDYEDKKSVSEKSIKELDELVKKVNKTMLKSIFYLKFHQVILIQYLPHIVCLDYMQI